MKLSSNRSSAFTLIELLVVIGIVAVLASFLLPVLSSVRKRADSAKCVSNLRQLGAAVLLYAANNNMKMPPVTYVDAQPEIYWRRAITPYIATANTRDALWQGNLICPEIERIVRKNGGKTGISSFALNQYLDKELSMAFITRASKIILATESPMGVNSELTIPLEFVVPARIAQPGNLHNGANNILYVDGHVDSWKGVETLNAVPYKAGSTDDRWKP